MRSGASRELRSPLDELYGVVLVVLVIRIIRNGKVDLIVEGTMLSNRDEDGLMVCGGVDCRSAVNTRGQATSDDSGKNAVDSRIIKTFEEREFGWVRNNSGLKRIKLLNDDVRMRDEDALSINLSWGGEVVGRGVDEETGVEVADGDVHGEVGIGWNHIEIRG